MLLLQIKECRMVKDNNMILGGDKPIWYMLLKLLLSQKMTQKWKRLGLGLIVGLVCDYVHNVGLRESLW